VHDGAVSPAALAALLYLLAINAAAYLAMAADKQRAMDDARRIPERTLLNMALIGGALGAVAAQQMLRHKTRKEPFHTRLWLIAAAWGALLWWAAERIG
jgi:uncharacterized membrane protein YsdA (DUF1294 family)